MGVVAMFLQQDHKFDKKAEHQWCDWCCRKFVMAVPKRFCGKNCTWAWMKARDRREQSE